MIFNADIEYQQEQPEVAATCVPPALHGTLSALAQRLFCTGNGLAVRSVMLTAVHPRSGVSYISSCLSTIVAEMFGASLLVDGQVLVNMARRKILPLLSDCAVVNESRLRVLGRATAAQMKAKGSSDADVGAVLKSLLSDVDFAVIDAPALSASSAAKVLCPEVDGVILVVVPHETDLHDIKNARIALSSHGAQVLGAIYNNRFDTNSTGVAL